MKRITAIGNEYGASLLELCVAVSLSALVLSGATISLRRIVQWYHVLRSRYESEQAILEAYAILERGYSHIESSRRLNTWRIHKGGSISLADGTLHPIMRLQGTSLPRPNSDALSLLEFAPHNAAAIRPSSNSTTSVCNVIANVPRAERVLSLLTVGIHGSEHLAIDGTTQGIIWPASCGELRTFPLKSVFIRPFTPRIAHQIALPIVQEYTVFIDRSSHLRLISHRGTWIRENQPLVDGIREITFTEKYITPDILSFVTSIKAVGGVTRTWQRVITLSRKESIDDTLF